MNRHVLIVSAAACGLFAVALAQPAGTESKAVTAALDTREALVKQAQDRYDTIVKDATEARDKTIDSANEAATKTLLAMAKRQTQSGNLAEALNLYKVICSFNPTNKEAVAALKAVGIEPEGSEVAAAAGKFKTVEYRFRVQASVSASAKGWTKIPKPIQAGDVVHFDPSGKYSIGGTEYTPQGETSGGGRSGHLEARFTCAPDNVFYVGAGGMVAAPAAGTLELRLAIRDDRRSLAKGQITVIVGVEK